MPTLPPTRLLAPFRKVHFPIWALFAQVNAGEPVPSHGDKAGVIWPMRTCGLVTAGECGSRLNAVRNVYEKKESGNRQSHGPGPMSNKELARRETPEDTLHCTVSECTGNPSSAAVTLPDCNCGSVGSRRLRMINRAVIQTSSHNR